MSALRPSPGTGVAIPDELSEGCLRTDFTELGQAAKENMKENYTWEKIVGEYEDLFLS